ncbi:MAG TPA: ATP synthase F1 subunit delta [Anaeromyxobacter sp.]|nr:ATP synthase F1 subunit delta [Anaeromyxobacter sp.]
MDSGSVARRYAKALFGLAVESGRVEVWNDSLAALGEALSQSPDLEEILSDPVLGREERHAVAKRLGEALGLEAEPTNLLLLLADRNRLDRLADVLRAFGELSDAHLGRMRARVTSAVPLSPEALDAISHRLSEVTRSRVLLERTVEPALIGGVVAQVGSVVYDGSVRTQLADLRKSLKR